MAPIRLATVKATKKRYIVNSIQFARNGATIDQARSKVLCWGEVRSYKLPGRTVHEKSKTFLLDAVEIKEVERTAHLLNSLWAQGLEALEAKGYTVRLSRTGKSATVVPPVPPEVDAERRLLSIRDE